MLGIPSDPLVLIAQRPGPSNQKDGATVTVGAAVVRVTLWDSHGYVCVRVGPYVVGFDGTPWNVHAAALRLASMSEAELVEIALCSWVLTTLRWRYEGT